MAAVLRRPRVDYSHGILDDYAASPGARPFSEHRVAIDRVLEAGDKALLSLLSIRGQEEREQVEAVHVFLKDLVEIGAACVGTGSGDLLCFRHGYLPLSFTCRLSLVEIDNEACFL